MNDMERFLGELGTYVEIGPEDLHWAKGTVTEKMREANLTECLHLHASVPKIDLCFGELVSDHEGDWWFNFIPANTMEFQTTLFVGKDEQMDFMKAYIIRMVCNGSIQPRTPEGIGAISLGTISKGPSKKAH